ncbi:hypothetical protein L1987_13710 [Smallanthus sonchifolius]|uniref:Uncharacterized protein n=1 Tax=Smallanthus sonchifolius TaxID=185202 RepID=A0ACB9JJL9_9ASTR|nr:hypothetical protein L1987_13710 [Smallanthus sonchifolius]
MATTHRKLLQQQDSAQNSTCSDCGPTCPYKCSYPEFYWPPPPPHNTTTTHMSPYAIIIVTLLGSAFLFFTYYLIMSSVINSISVFKYKKGDNLIDGTDCSVCLTEFQDDEMLRLLPKCNHAFHIPCIDMWLSSHTNCPLCRAGILSNTLSAVLSSDDQRFLPRSGSDPNTQMEDLDNHGGLGGNPVPEIEIVEENEDSKTEFESVTDATGSISIDSIAVIDIIFGELEGVSDGSTTNIVTSRSHGEI